MSAPNVILTIELPVPPSLNEMIDLAKQRSVRRIPVIYNKERERYETRSLVALSHQRIVAPPDPWPRWRIVSAHFRLHNLRDWVELMASLKWPVDVLVTQRFVVDDSPRELLPPPIPTQVINRRQPGVILQIAEGWDV